MGRRRCKGVYSEGTNRESTPSVGPLKGMLVAARRLPHLGWVCPEQRSAQRARTGAPEMALPEDRSEVTDAPQSLKAAGAVGIQGAWGSEMKRGTKLEMIRRRWNKMDQR